MSDWYEYTVAVAQSGPYTVEARVASGATDAAFHIEVDGEDATGPIAVPEADGEQAWRTVAVPRIELAAGEHVIRMSVDGDGLNINYLRFLHKVTEDAIPAGTAAPSRPTARLPARTRPTDRIDRR